MFNIMQWADKISDEARKCSTSLKISFTCCADKKGKYCMYGKQHAKCTVKLRVCSKRSIHFAPWKVYTCGFISKTHAIKSRGWNLLVFYSAQEMYHHIDHLIFPFNKTTNISNCCNLIWFSCSLDTYLFIYSQNSFTLKQISRYNLL